MLSLKCIRKSENLNQEDRLTGQIESLAALDVPARHHIIYAHHIRTRLGEFRAIFFIAAAWRLRLLRAHHPAHRKCALLPAMGAHEWNLLRLFFLVVELSLIHNFVHPWRSHRHSRMPHSLPPNSRPRKINPAPDYEAPKKTRSASIFSRNEFVRTSRQFVRISNQFNYP